MCAPRSNDDGSDGEIAWPPWVTCTRDDWNAPRAGTVTGVGDAAIGDREGPAPRLAGGREHAAPNLVDDAVRILGPRVVGGQHHEVAEPRRHRPHQRALGAVPIAAAAEDADETAGPETAHRPEPARSRTPPAERAAAGHRHPAAVIEPVADLGVDHRRHVEPAEAESPLNTLHSLQALLVAPYDGDAAKRQLRRRRRKAIRAASRHFQGTLRWRFWWRLWVARRYYPNRERAMFELGRAWTVLRPFARELGRRLAEAGTLHEPEDIFFLTTDELGRAVRSIPTIE